MSDTINASTILQTAMTAKDPAKALLDLAAKLLVKGERKGLRDIDVMLDGRFINFVRNDALDDLSSFACSVVAFIDSEKGDKLKSTESGRRLFHRWEHLRDLCGFAVENRDPDFAGRFVRSRKHGERLMQILHGCREGIRPMDLAEQLGISRQQLSKLLREFKTEDLILRETVNGVTFVRLGFIGKAYMLERMSEFPPDGAKEFDPWDSGRTGFPNPKISPEPAGKAPDFGRFVFCDPDSAGDEVELADLDQAAIDAIAGMTTRQRASSFFFATVHH